jgi:hypothetical protein
MKKNSLLKFCLRVIFGAVYYERIRTQNVACTGKTRHLVWAAKLLEKRPL